MADTRVATEAPHCSIRVVPLDKMLPSLGEVFLPENLETTRDQTCHLLLTNQPHRVMTSGFVLSAARLELSDRAWWHP